MDHQRAEEQDAATLVPSLYVPRERRGARAEEGKPVEPVEDPSPGSVPAPAAAVDAPDSLSQA